MTKLKSYKKMKMGFLKKTLQTSWNEFLKYITNNAILLIGSGGAGLLAWAITGITELQALIRSVQSDYFLIAIILMVISFGILLKINRSQNKQLNALQKDPNAL